MKGATDMASSMKFTDDLVRVMLNHNMRLHSIKSNEDIDPSKTHLNYSFDADHGGLSPYKYYQKLLGDKYLYGRGTAREKESITAVGWVITCPKEIAGDPVKEKSFFKASYDFVCNRYGAHNIINNVIHHDEKGRGPHMHIVFMPSTKIDHELAHHKTIKTKKAIKTETGRYEYETVLKKDKSGNPIPIRNYAKMLDYYDEKISAKDVMNRAEMQHFHSDLQTYLNENGVEGAVLNGATGGANITVKALKEFTKATGLTLDDVQALKLDHEIVQSDNAYIKELTSELAEKNKVIKDLIGTIEKKDATLSSAQQEIEQLQQKVKELEKSATVNNQEKTWGDDAWGNNNSWGNSQNPSQKKGDILW